MSYAGDVTPEAAWELITTTPDAVLVDVRTQDEWRTIGVPDTSEARTAARFVEWNTAWGPNTEFLAQLEAAGVAKDATVLFLCRSGVRSVAAAQAATAAGWADARNVLQGFEGAQDATGARTIDGWRNAGLPTTTIDEAAR